MTMSLLFGKTLFRVVNTIFASERMTILCWGFLTTLISYGFIMNLDNGFYSKNGNDTVLSPEPIGQVDHLTTGDVLRVRLLYQCRSGPRMYDDYLAH